MPYLIPDAESDVLQESYAVIRTPRLNRKRFPESCVSLVASPEIALGEADSTKHLYPAVVYGPSVSSEGQRIYYLVRWLEGH